MRGLELSRRFYEEAVRPILAKTAPDIGHAAALIGPGSEVLGFDDDMSRDHAWGPRLLLFLRPVAYARDGAAIHDAFANQLPLTFEGFSTNFTRHGESGSSVPETVRQGPVRHRVAIHSVETFTREVFGVAVGDEPIAAADWLTFPHQSLRSVVAGEVFHDGIRLDVLREQLRWPPDDVWRYLLAAGWMRISQEEHLVGRAAFVGDELGSSLIAARLVRDAMRLAFLMERVYAPYAKWFGTAFRELACAPELTPVLEGVIAARSWSEREVSLVSMYEHLAQMHNGLGLTEPMPETVRLFHDRPIRVMAMHGFADRLLASVSDLAVRRIATRPLVGGIDQISDNTDVLTDPMSRATARRFFDAPDALVPIIKYWNFCDYPRAFLVRWARQVLFFDGPFDDELDEYPDEMSVYQVDDETLHWEELADESNRVGTVHVTRADFDDTCRASIRASVVLSVI